MINGIQVSTMTGSYRRGSYPHKWKIERSGDEYIVEVSDQCSDHYDGKAYDTIDNALDAVRQIIKEAA